MQPVNSTNRPIKGLMLAAPSSGSGKTLLTLALLRAFKDAGMDVVGAKAGPDFIDPVFHEYACGKPSVNLDPWAMSPERLASLANGQKGEFLIIEAMMGLYDGAADGTGSAADLALSLNLPVILVVDAAKQSHSIAALVEGFQHHRKDLTVAGVILNKVGSERHETILRQALTVTGLPVFGAIYRGAELSLPERHLGLVQASEHDDIDQFIGKAAKLVSEKIDLEALANVATVLPQENSASALPKLGQRIAVADDTAFRFFYPHWKNDWLDQGVEILPFSPLADEAPDPDCDAIYLPGGYPELYAGKLASNFKFISGLQTAAKTDKVIYGECGGYMVLGEGLIDADGTRHQMSGLLGLETSFEKRKLHLGYRAIKTLGPFALGADFLAHEFHYSSVIKEKGTPLFEVKDALGENLGTAGLHANNVSGSYMHIIDRIAR